MRQFTTKKNFPKKIYCFFRTAGQKLPTCRMAQILRDVFVRLFRRLRLARINGWNIWNAFLSKKGIDVIEKKSQNY